MKNNKTILKLLSVLMIILSMFLCGCRLIPDLTDSNKKEKSINYSSLSKDPLSFDILLDNKKYTLPVKFSELEKDGWEIDPHEKSYKLPPNRYFINIELKRKHDKITVTMVNKDSEILNLNKCYVSSVCSFGKIVLSNPSLVLPQGITFNTSKEKLISTYGKPSETDTSGELYDSYYYFSSHAVDKFNQKIEFMIDRKTHNITGIEVKNMYTPDDLKGQVPDYN